MPLLSHFPFQRNPREFIDNVPQLSQVFLCRFDAAQQRQSKVYLKRTRKVVSAADRHWRALFHGSELLRILMTHDGVCPVPRLAHKLAKMISSALARLST